jgi:hypothetical protein
MDDPASLLLLLFAESSAPTAEGVSLVGSTLNILLVIFLVLANGFFVASEFALVAVRKSRRQNDAWNCLTISTPIFPPRSLELRLLLSVWAGSANRRWRRFWNRVCYGLAE